MEVAPFIIFIIVEIMIFSVIIIFVFFIYKNLFRLALNINITTFIVRHES